ncbi:hypothetical protein N1851_033504 [Merluccius polli]|uniref:Uncharacterized protein n=1 Tax=Merluccius polli TaxID=89951 RepID=A0AA47M132_MERPO|nr:hypothetical protein N1851_033504 [Merluccius polli]
MPLLRRTYSKFKKADLMLKRQEQEVTFPCMLVTPWEGTSDINPVLVLDPTATNRPTDQPLFVRPSVRLSVNFSDEPPFLLFLGGGEQEDYTIQEGGEEEEEGGEKEEKPWGDKKGGDATPRGLEVLLLLVEEEEVLLVVVVVEEAAAPLLLLLLSPPRRSRGGGREGTGRMDQACILRKFIQGVTAMREGDERGEDNFGSDFMLPSEKPETPPSQSAGGVGGNRSMIRYASIMGK